MSDEVNTEEVQPINPEPAQPTEQAESTQDASPLERPENIPEKFWDAEKGEIMTDEFLKSYTNLEQYVGGKKEELKDELIDELFSDYYSQVLRSRINIIPSSANSLEKIKLFIKEHLKIGYNFYLLFVSKKINIEKLKKYPSENYLSFKEINNFIDNY